MNKSLSLLIARVLSFLWLVAPLAPLKKDDEKTSVHMHFSQEHELPMQDSWQTVIRFPDQLDDEHLLMTD